MAPDVYETTTGHATALGVEDDEACATLPARLGRQAYGGASGAPSFTMLVSPTRSAGSGSGKPVSSMPPVPV